MNIYRLRQTYNQLASPNVTEKKLLIILILTSEPNAFHHTCIIKTFNNEMGHAGSSCLERLLTSVQLCQKAKPGANKEELRIFDLNHRKKMFLIPL